MATIGTAGHVDHGKSSLVYALTGIDPDRLAEEKARGMTIDLGFAWLTLPEAAVTSAVWPSASRTIGIVDVPGHEDFIKNMLAGVGGIDLALLVIAADESVMPQTREHLAILDLLGIDRCIVVLTKRDLVDEEWLEAVREDVQATLAPTRFHAATIVPVSARTGAGIAELIATIASTLPPAEDRAPRPGPQSTSARLPVDRVFTVRGHGTVVTGTLRDGELRVGDEIEAAPEGRRGKIRGLQVHGTPAERAEPGTRVALNLSGIGHDAIARGTVIAPPGTMVTSTQIDIHLALWPDATRSLIHNARVECFSGTAQTLARLRLLDCDEVQPDQALRTPRTFAQLILDHPIAVRRGDHCILRIPSPSETVGGGIILDPAPRYHRRRDPRVLGHLAAIAAGDIHQLILAQLSAHRRGAPLLLPDALAAATGLARPSLDAALDQLIAGEQVRTVGDYRVTAESWETLRTTSRAILGNYHQQFRLRIGMSREAWRTQLRLDPRQADAVFAWLSDHGEIAAAGGSAGWPGPGTEDQHPAHHVGALAQVARFAALVRLPDHTPQWNDVEAAQRDALCAALAIDALNPPPRSTIDLLAPPEVLAATIESGLVVKLNEDVFLAAEAAHNAIQRILAALEASPEGLSVSALRDLLGATRRVVVPLLEALDAAHLTRRVGEVRVRVQRSRSPEA